MDETATELLDLCGLKCPMPALLLRRALKSAISGTRFEVVATDPLAEVDLPFAAGQAGAEVLSVTSLNGQVRVLLRK